MNRNLRHVTHLAIAALLATPVSLAAGLEDLPKRKPGLWEMTIVPAEGQRALPPSKMCIDAATDMELMRFGLGMSNELCSKHEASVSGSAATVDTVCKIGESQVTSHSTIKYTGNSAYRTEVKSNYNPPFLGKTESNTIQEAKWTGPCPAEMKPGDLVTGTGVKVNLKELTSSKK
jgi:hypothetical protein